MNKKLFSVICLLIVFLFCGCGKGSTASNQNTTGEREELPQETIVNTPQIDPSLIGKTFASGNYEYTVQEDGTVYISGYIGNDTELTLPVELDEYVVSGVAANAFDNAESVSSLVVPGTIYMIGKEAFAGCVNLKKVTIEEGVQYIASRAFANGTGYDFNSSTVEEATIPDSIVRMGERPFGLRTNVGHVSNGLLYIGKFVVDVTESFDGHIIFEEDTRGIADEAFLTWNPNVVEVTDTTVEIPEGVIYIGEAAFAGQDYIDYFKVPSTVVEIGSCALLYDEVNNGYSKYHSSDTQKIYGNAGTVAEMYATENGFNFVIVNN